MINDKIVEAVAYFNAEVTTLPAATKALFASLHSHNNEFRKLIRLVDELMSNALKWEGLTLADVSVQKSYTTEKNTNILGLVYTLSTKAPPARSVPLTIHLSNNTVAINGRTFESVEMQIITQQISNYIVKRLAREPYQFAPADMYNGHKLEG